jgi:hypothetical protein
MGELGSDIDDLKNFEVDLVPYEQFQQFETNEALQGLSESV